MKVLHLTLKKEWFDLIRSGEKKEEYREVKPYWITRLAGREYDVIRFRNGYSPQSPVFDVVYEGLTRGIGNSGWGAPDYPVYILRLGAVIENKNAS